MNTDLLAIPRSLPATSPEETLRAFCEAYSLEEVREELWRCFNARLMAVLKDLDPESANRLADLHGNLEVLLSAIYQLPAHPLLEGNSHG